LLFTFSLFLSSLSLLAVSGISVWNEHSPKIESVLAENKVSHSQSSSSALGLSPNIPFVLLVLAGNNRREADTQGIV